MTAITAPTELLNVVEKLKKSRKKAPKRKEAAGSPSEDFVTESASAEPADVATANVATANVAMADVATVDVTAADVAADQKTEYTIDELAATTHVSSRTIRFYQSKGALPRPKIKGRIAYYSELHLERLGHIAKLQDQGLRIRAIRDLLAKADKGELVLDEWLGFKAQLQAPWAEDVPLVLSEDALYELIGDRRQGLIGQLLRLKVVRKDRQSYAVRSPALLKLTMKLTGAGVDLETAVEGARILRKHLARAAGELAQHFLKRLGDGPIGEHIDALRPAGLEAVQLIFAQEIERSLRELVESGKLLK